MCSLEKVFARLREQRKKALIPYLMGFYPDRGAFREILLAADRAGADAIEIGIPFSDPIADGPVIQEAGQKALASGAAAGRILDDLAGLKGELSAALALMTYANVVISFGVERFFDRAAGAGVVAALIPDLSLEESAPFREAAKAHGIDLVQFVSPTTPESRMSKIAEVAGGFIYIVSVTGVTGARPGEGFDLGELIGSVKSYADLPVCVGFGISTPAQARAVTRMADGAIIGSAIIEIIKKTAPGDEAAAVEEYLGKVRRAMDTTEDHDED